MEGRDVRRFFAETFRKLIRRVVRRIQDLLALLAFGFGLYMLYIYLSYG